MSEKILKLNILIKLKKISNGNLKMCNEIQLKFNPEIYLGTLWYSIMTGVNLCLSEQFKICEFVWSLLSVALWFNNFSSINRLVFNIPNSQFAKYFAFFVSASFWTVVFLAQSSWNHLKMAKSELQGISI